jgi:hypothetical protein
MIHDQCHADSTVVLFFFSFYTVGVIYVQQELSLLFLMNCIEFIIGLFSSSIIMGSVGVVLILHKS